MKPLARSELIASNLYAQLFEKLLPEAEKAKARREIAVGSLLLFVFENRETIWYAVQERLRLDHITDEREVERHLQTYNALLGAPGELACTLYVRDEMNARDDPRVYVVLESGVRVAATPVDAPDGWSSPSLHHVKFRVGCFAPVAIGSDHPRFAHETTLSEAQRAVLQHDLDSDPPD